jgi:phenylalanyl-tRNA synthetase beta chain
VVGVPYSSERIAEILAEIGCQAELRGDTFTVSPPSWRPDLTEPIDLVEEIVRADGYDKIPSVLPAAPGGRGLTPAQRKVRSVARALAEAGLVETLSYPFVPTDNPMIDPNALKLANPLGDDRPARRTNLLATLLETAARNVARGQSDFGVFEVGAVALPQPEGATPKATHATPAPVPPVGQRPDAQTLAAIHAAVPNQPLKVAGVLVGNAELGGWWGPGRKASWQDALELAAMVADRVGVETTFRRVSDPHTSHPGRSAELVVASGAAAGKSVGGAGELHPKICDHFGVPHRTVAFELDLSALLGAGGQSADSGEPAAAGGDPEPGLSANSGGSAVVTARPISAFPLAKEDFAFVVPEATPAQAVANAITASAGDLLEELRLFDVFTGAQIGEGNKSLAFSLKLRAPDRTLKPEEVSEVRESVISGAAKIGAQLRS